MNSVARLLLSVLAVGSLLVATGCGAGSSTGPRFDIRLTEDAQREMAELGLDTPLSGRLFLVVSDSDEREPRLQTGVSGVPFWGMMVDDVVAGEWITMNPDDAEVYGFPLASPSELPPGRYHIQALLSVYTTFERSDGHTVSMHLNSGAGQNQWRAPGNVYSAPMSVRVEEDSENGLTVLELDYVIQPPRPLEAGQTLQQGNPEDTEWVKYVKIRSQLLSDFWGHDMYIGANVLLPAGYDRSSRAYPALYMQGHFPGERAPLGFTEEGSGRGRSEGFPEHWKSGEAPGVIAVSFRDANPYYDTSYSVNSDNLGPYGDAITSELIPYLEEQFRIIPESWARVVAGGSTGGWEALAMQIFYPDYYGGAWGWCPDPVDFNYYQIVNVYEDDNAYSTGNTWHQVERPNARRFDGNIRSTVRQENYLEYATGPDSRSGGQWAIWEAVFGPVGENGYPRPIWDPISGEIDPETAAHWRSNYDLHQHLKNNWESVGPLLDGKLHVAVGDMDSYYLDNAVYLLEEFMQSATGPRIEASFEYGRRKPHCWTGYSPSGSGEDISNVEFLQVVADHFREQAPRGTVLP